MVTCGYHIGLQPYRQSQPVLTPQFFATGLHVVLGILLQEQRQ